MRLVVLDLDETLIHSCSEWIGRKHDFIAGNQMVFVRPGAIELIKSLSGKYRLAVWTASYGKYTEEIIRNIFPDNISLEFVWDRTHCHRITNEKQDYFEKDISKLYEKGFGHGEFSVIDDRPEYIIGSKEFVIAVRPYYGSSDDDELLSLISEFENI